MWWWVKVGTKTGNGTGRTMRREERTAERKGSTSYRLPTGDFWSLKWTIIGNSNRCTQWMGSATKKSWKMCRGEGERPDGRTTQKRAPKADGKFPAWCDNGGMTVTRASPAPVFPVPPRIERLRCHGDSDWFALERMV
jgi:hypothetical protein